MELVYVASPYTHSDPKIVEENFIKVSKYVSHMCSLGHVYLSPITYGHTLLEFKDMPSDWKFWSNFCLVLLKKCDKLVVYQIEGWDQSRGVAEEIEFAKEHNIPIEYVSELQ